MGFGDGDKPELIEQSTQTAKDKNQDLQAEETEAHKAVPTIARDSTEKPAQPEAEVDRALYLLQASSAAKLLREERARTRMEQLYMKYTDAARTDTSRLKSKNHQMEIACRDSTKSISKLQEQVNCLNAKLDAEPKYFNDLKRSEKENKKLKDSERRLYEHIRKTRTDHKEHLEQQSRMHREEFGDLKRMNTKKFEEARAMVERLEQDKAAATAEIHALKFQCERHLAVEACRKKEVEKSSTRRHTAKQVQRLAQKSMKLTNKTTLRLSNECKVPSRILARPTDTSRIDMNNISNAININNSKITTAGEIEEKLQGEITYLRAELDGCRCEAERQSQTIEMLRHDQETITGVPQPIYAAHIDEARAIISSQEEKIAEAEKNCQQVYLEGAKFYDLAAQYKNGGLALEKQVAELKKAAKSASKKLGIMTAARDSATKSLNEKTKAETSALKRLEEMTEAEQSATKKLEAKTRAEELASEELYQMTEARDSLLGQQSQLVESAWSTSRELIVLKEAQEEQIFTSDEVIQDLLREICVGDHNYDGDDVNAIRLVYRCNAAIDEVRNKVQNAAFEPTSVNMTGLRNMLANSLLDSKGIIETLQNAKTQHTPRLLQHAVMAAPKAKKLFEPLEDITEDSDISDVVSARHELHLRLKAQQTDDPNRRANRHKRQPKSTLRPAATADNAGPSNAGPSNAGPNIAGPSNAGISNSNVSEQEDDGSWAQSQIYS